MTASDDATYHIVFILHELTKTVMGLLKHSLIPPKSTKLTFLEAAEVCLSASGSFPLPCVQITMPNS